MTTIVAANITGSLYIAADTKAGSESYTKILQVADGYLGFSGPLFILQAIEDILDDQQIQRIALPRDMFTFVLFLREELQDYEIEFDTDEKSGALLLPFQLLYVSSAGIFISYGTGECSKVTSNFAAIGSGAPYALGYLHGVFSKPESNLPEAILTDAIQVAALYDKETGKETIVKSVKNSTNTKH